ncbi:MAG TPA: protein kinase [Kofleriaceae bacterium]|nr:protein kinase [Kofleriaceae bacterium]
MATGDDRVGSLIEERYRIIAPMAEGSMGAVYKAERVPVGKLVAVKFLHATYANDSEFQARFERETRVMSKLAHPNCVSVVDFGVWNGAPYLVMEFVGGQTLRAILDQEGALPVPRALSIGRQIIAGLAHAHAQGITHRDVKPANLMINEEIGAGEHVRILDFGLARLRGAGNRDATQANVVVGTPNYMAPEQTIGGGIIDARTDIYAVGIVLFEMIAGQRPFQAEDTLSLLGMHRAAPIPLLAERAPRGVEIPAGLQAILEKAMAKSPDDRFQTAIAFAEALDALVGRTAMTTDPRGLPVVRPSMPQIEPLSIAPTRVDLDSRSEVATIVNPERDPSERADRGSGRGAGRGGPVGAASTVPPARRGSGAGVMLALLILGGGTYAAYYVKSREAKQADAAQGSGEVAQGSAALDAAGSGRAPDPAGSGGSGEPAAGSGAGGTQVAVGSGSGEPTGTGSAGSGEPAGGSGSGSGAGSGSAGDGEVEAVPSPAEATNPDPAGATSATAVDEDENAPKTQAEVDKRVKPAAPALATTIAGAVKLIQDGKRDLALASLLALYQKQPKSSYIPFLLGNLYFDQRWWSVAMEHYRASITREAGYRYNATLIRNVIRMLISNKTSRQAEFFLKKTIGRPSLPYLQQTARTDQNAYMRKYATALARQIR